MLDLAILGLLREEALHGYELRRQLSDFGFWSVSFGSLYPAMRRLEKLGYIETDDQTGRRKEYHLTPEGKAQLQEMLEDDSTVKDDERSFNLRLAFFRYMEPESRLGVLERRRGHLVDRMASSRASMKQRAARTKQKMDRYTLALMEHGIESAQADIAWLDDLIETERALTPKKERARSRKARSRAERLIAE
ncbi:MAG: PadR family transcriptional regulator [Acidimicrobiia bacterium]|nr:PadR family transcriptional regulator [Acidimicrobiia bacterium]MDH3470089.1 PadR family transcriptional regulator [Acidimicrobiia bacterium]